MAFGLGVYLGISRRVVTGGGGVPPVGVNNINDIGGIVWNFATPVPAIQYADGVWASLLATVTSITPASAQLSGVHSDTGTYTNVWRHGAMSSAVALGNQSGIGLQGWDEHQSPSLATTEVEYSHAFNVDPAKTGASISGVQIIAKARSRLTPQESARDNVDDLAILYNVASLPPAGSFRMWDAADVPVFNVSEMDMYVIPLVALPSGATLPTMASIRSKYGPINLFMRNNLFMRGVNPNNQQSNYGGDIANDISDMWWMVACSAVPLADRTEILTRLVASGILIAYGSEAGARWSSATFSNGGGQQWLKILVVIAARVMRNAANATAKAVLNKWADAVQQKVFADDLMVFSVNRESIESVGTGTINTRPAPQGYRSFMENTVDWNSKPSGDQGSYLFEMAYRNANGPAFMTWATAARMMGAEVAWGNGEFFEYSDRWWNWWNTRNKATQSDLYYSLFARRFLDDYYQTYSPAYQGAASPTRARLVVRDDQAWVECNENLDMRFVPAPGDFTLLADGSPVSLATVSTTATGALSTGSTNVQFPIISVASAAGIRVGMRVVSANLPADTLVVSVSGVTIGISSRVPASFSSQPITFSPVVVYGRSLCLCLPTPATQGQVYTLAYTAPGANAARNLRGVNLASFTAQSMTNTTGLLPAPALAREMAYSGPLQADRQYLAAQQPPSEVIRRLQISVRFWLESKNANDTVISSSTGSASNFRLYFATLTDLRILIAGQSFRMPGSGTALPLNTEITAHFLFDFTETTYPAIYRGVYRWNGGEHIASTTGSTGVLDGLLAPNIATIFGTTPQFGIGFGANANGSFAMDGAISQLALRWGGSGLSQPTDFSGSQFAWDGDWGGNAENLHGVAPHRFYSLTISDANSKVINRGGGGAAAMTPRRLDASGEDLLTYYTLAT